MPCDCVEINKWTAVLNKQPIEPPKLSVKGKADCNTGGYTNVHLKEHHPQGINPRDLLLELVWTPPYGTATDVISHHDVSFKKQPSPDYDTVTITNCKHASIKVEIVT